MPTLGKYSDVARSYNGVNTISYQIPESISEDGTHLLIDGNGLKLFVDTKDEEITRIKFNVTDMYNPTYPGTFQGFEFGMHWKGNPSYISSFINARNNPGKLYVSKGLVEYSAKVDRNTHELVVTLSPGS
ncbi:hypothetical protein ESZ50_11000 [Weissella muntiaci]|uniref:Uncharacterized protein n=1 Tax=Weissella muntiaci TaxID=2508881 RepID=A0A6C2C1Q2_9LACO|nr:hypothetical protein [Weissella muntiaci]TYC47874.1 hypothetical protein ESZ50_11000 [Weissella muntiaci]